MAHTFVIAECGSCHDNSFTKALRLIDAAKHAGADAAKFQYWSSPGKLAARRGLGPDAKAVYERYQLPKSWLPNLKEYCDGVGIEFMCTTYLIEDIPEITPLVKRYKVSAFEAQWKEFLEAHPIHSDLIVSLNPGKHIPALQTRHAVDVLHCVSEYPCPLEHLGLEQAEIGHEWWKSGLSDHTTSTLTGALVVAQGASIIEKHLRLVDTHKECPDFGHSLETQDFKKYVENIREAERCL